MPSLSLSWDGFSRFCAFLQQGSGTLFSSFDVTSNLHSNRLVSLEKSVRLCSSTCSASASPSGSRTGARASDEPWWSGSSPRPRRWGMKPCWHHSHLRWPTWALSQEQICIRSPSPTWQLQKLISWTNRYIHCTSTIVRPSLEKRTWAGAGNTCHELVHQCNQRHYNFGALGRE